MCRRLASENLAGALKEHQGYYATLVTLRKCEVSRELAYKQRFSGGRAQWSGQRERPPDDHMRIRGGRCRSQYDSLVRPIREAYRLCLTEFRGCQTGSSPTMS
jgi:hypothetical protein